MKIEVKQPLSILEILELAFPDSSRRTLRSWLKNGRISVDGEIINKASTPMAVAQEIIVGERSPQKKCPLPILYEDNDLVIINKPVGLLSVPLDNAPSTNALTLLRDFYGTREISAVHRIDRETSGVLVFTKTKEARKGMDILFKNHDLIREYHAIVEGKFSAKKGQWRNYLIESAPHKVRSTKNCSEGKQAITHYEVVRIMKNTTFLKLILETGRKHQIRVHCQEAGHPILGDKRYGSTNNHYKRLCLHAHRIAFKHPITKEAIDVMAPTIGFMKQILK